MGPEGLAGHSHQAAEVLLLVAAAVAAAGLVALSSFASSPPTPSESCKSSQQACGSIAISNLPSHTYLLPPSYYKGRCLAKSRRAPDCGIWEVDGPIRRVAGKKGNPVFRRAVSSTLLVGALGRDHPI